MMSLEVKLNNGSHSTLDETIITSFKARLRGDVYNAPRK
jgi:hypothetical protein